MTTASNNVASLTEHLNDSPEMSLDKQQIIETVYAFFEKQVDDQAPKKKHRMAVDSPLEDFGMDSLEVLSVAMDLEEHFDLFIPDEVVESFTTIAEVAGYLEQALADKSKPADANEQTQPETGCEQ